jgi:hypothetical protein
MSKSPNIDAMRAETREGHCIACDYPLPPKPPGRIKRRYIHDNPECRRLYQRIYNSDRRAHLRDERNRKYLAEDFMPWARGESP